MGVGHSYPTHPTRKVWSVNMTTHAWQMCLSTTKPGMKGGDTVPPTPTPTPGVDDTSWALTAQSPFPPPWSCHGDRSRRDTR